MQEDRDRWYDQYYADLPPASKYILTIYFTITTMTTVGYGDMSANTTVERTFCCVLMIFGVVSFTFVSGALSSIISNKDATEANL